MTYSLKNIFLYITLVSGLLSLTSCDKKTVLHAYYPIDEAGWKDNDTLLFRIDSVQQTDIYDIRLEMRIKNEISYPYIHLVVEREFEPLCQTQCDTVIVPIKRKDIRQQRNGMHHAQLEVKLASQTLSKGQNGTIRIYHIMDHCFNVSDVGIHMEH